MSDLSLSLLISRMSSSGCGEAWACLGEVEVEQGRLETLRPPAGSELAVRLLTVSRCWAGDGAVSRELTGTHSGDSCEVRLPLLPATLSVTSHQLSRDSLVQVLNLKFQFIPLQPL